VIGTLTMTAGTAVGGWRIIKTLGDKLVHLRPITVSPPRPLAASPPGC
jgi:phosphate/sulfate permease